MKSTIVMSVLIAMTSASDTTGKIKLMQKGR